MVSLFAVLILVGAEPAPFTAATAALLLVRQDADGYFKKGLEKQEKGDLAGAISDYSRALEIDPKYASAYVSRGRAKASKGDKGGAVADFTSAIEIDPSFGHAYFSRGEARMMKRDLDGAIADFSRSIEIDPKDSMAYNLRGISKRRQGDLDGAIVDLTRALQIDPKNSSVYRSRGLAKKYRGDFDGAIADLTRALEITPKNASAFVDRGTSKKAKGDVIGAKVDYARALETDPKVVQSYRYRACTFYNMHFWIDALETFRNMCELDPFNQDYPRLRIWLIRARQGESDAATKELDQYLKERKAGLPGDWASKIAQFLIGDLSEVEFLKAAESKDAKIDSEQKCEAWFYAGSRRIIQGDTVGAKEYFKKCIETGVKGFSEYESAAAELETLK